MDYIDVFRNYESDFYHYMVSNGNLGFKTSRDYISRLRFLAQSYLIDGNISEEQIENILRKEEAIMCERKNYNTKHAISDFRSGLRKFLNFIIYVNSNAPIKLVNEEVRKVEKDLSLTHTERTSIIQSRVGQGKFRESLISYWNGCSLSNCMMTQVLIASHIKPWCDCNNNERLDVFNGLLLLPNYDKLFDKGYITFDQKGVLVISHLLKSEEQEILGVEKGMSLNKIEEGHLQYLKYHNDYRFIG